VRSLGLISREGNNGKVFVRTQHNQFRTKYYSGFLLLVIVDLNGRVVRGSKGNYSCLVSLSSLFFFRVSLLGQQILYNLGQFLLPQFFVGLQHIRFSSNSSYFTSLDISYVDTFILVQRNSLSLLYNFYFYGRYKISGSIQHPTVSSLSLLLLVIYKVLFGFQKEGFFFRQDKYVLDSRFQSLSW